MGRIPNNNRKNRVRVEQSIDKLIYDIYKGEYVLVLGSDVVLKEEYGGGNSTTYIESEFDKEPLVCQTIEHRKREIYKYLQEDEEGEEGKCSWKYDLNEISEDLVRLIETKCFRIILTTTYDAYIETIMKEVYEKGAGEKVEVLNFRDPMDKNFIFNSKTEYGNIPPILFYAFGKAGSKHKNDYTYSENDKIKLISDWLGNNSPKNLIDYLKNKKILAIGCKFDDWHFRFFWYCLRQDFGHMVGDVAISLQDDNDSDKKLLKYLDQNDITDRGNSRAFLKKLSEELQYNSAYDEIRKKLKFGDIFISYAHEDFPIAYQICTVLLEQGYNVWFDVDLKRDENNNIHLNPGNDYDTRILNAINQCKVFIPILSKQIRDDLKEEKWRYYKDVEWEIIKDNKLATIIPLTIYGFDKNQDLHLLPEIFTNKHFADWTEGGRDSLINEINKLK